MSTADKVTIIIAVGFVALGLCIAGVLGRALRVIERLARSAERAEERTERARHPGEHPIAPRRPSGPILPDWMLGRGEPQTVESPIITASGGGGHPVEGGGHRA